MRKTQITFIITMSTTVQNLDPMILENLIFNCEKYKASIGDAMKRINEHLDEANSQGNPDETQIVANRVIFEIQDSNGHLYL